MPQKTASAIFAGLLLKLTRRDSHVTKVSHEKNMYTTIFKYKTMCAKS